MTMDIETRRKIARTMKGKSNFEGKRHTHATKLQIGFSQEGHRNAANHKWTVDKETGKEHRVTGDKPKGSRWGRTNQFSKWIHATEGNEVWDKPNPVKNHEKLSSSMKARAKARAKAAGRPYPNMVDNIWAAKNEDTLLGRIHNLLREGRAVTSFRSSGPSNSMQAWLGAHKTCPECKGQKPSGPFKVVKGVADNKPVCKDCQDDSQDK